MKFKNKVVVVTGASRGIGQAICVAFAKEGATVVGVARSDLAETDAAVKSVGGTFIAHNADLGTGTLKESAEVIAQILTKAGKIDVLVNNAGIIRRAPAADYSPEDWNQVLSIDLTAVFRLSQLAARQIFKQATPGKILNIASVLSFQGGILVPAYAAAKGGVVQLTRAFANEWAAKRINVNAIAPGYMATDNTAALRNDQLRSRQILERIPAGRWAGSPPRSRPRLRRPRWCRCRSRRAARCVRAAGLAGCRTG